jgi:RNA polymerase sigma-70 factor, ECF subfamily
MSFADRCRGAWPLALRVMSTSLGARRPDASPPIAEAAADFGALYDEHFDFVWRCLCRMGVDPSWAEDAAQDTFVVVHRRLHDLLPHASRTAFLYGIALRVARDYRRRARRKGAETLNEEGTISKDAGPFDQTAAAEAARLMERFLATLDEDKRAVFALVELEGMTAPEVSQALGVRINTVYSRLRVGRDRFIAYLRAAGHSHG